MSTNSYSLQSADRPGMQTGPRNISWADPVIIRPAGLNLRTQLAQQNARSTRDARGQPDPAGHKPLHYPRLWMSAHNYEIGEGQEEIDAPEHCIRYASNAFQLFLIPPESARTLTFCPYNNQPGAQQDAANPPWTCASWSFFCPCLCVGYTKWALLHHGEAKKIGLSCRVL